MARLGLPMRLQVPVWDLCLFTSLLLPGLGARDSSGLLGPPHARESYRPKESKIEAVWKSASRGTKTSWVWPTCPARHASALQLIASVLGQLEPCFKKWETQNKISHVLVFKWSRLLERLLIRRPANIVFKFRTKKTIIMHVKKLFST